MEAPWLPAEFGGRVASGFAGGGSRRLPCGQALQRDGYGIESSVEVIHAVEQRLRIRLSLRFELADAFARAPPGDAEAHGTDPENLSRHEQRAEKKAGRIHGGLPLARCLAA